MPLRGRVGRHTRTGGRHCQNWPDDQQSVISLLNRVPISDGGSAGRLGNKVISGICSDELYRAISSFEDKHFPGQGSGYVDPAGPMLKRIWDGLLGASGPAIIPKSEPESALPNIAPRVKFTTAGSPGPGQPAAQGDLRQPDVTATPKARVGGGR